MAGMKQQPSRSILILFVLFLAMSVHGTPTSAQTCPHNGDVNQNGDITPADALLAFQYYLGLESLDACQQDRANVDAPEASEITPADALCIFHKFLGEPSCLAPRLEAVVDDDVHAIVNAILPLVTRVTDASGQPIAMESVTFRRTAGSGTITPSQVLSNDNGEAATNLTVGSAAETTCIEASVAERPPIVFAITGVAEENIDRLVVVSGNNQVAAPGQEVPEPLVVRVETQFGNPLAGMACRQPVAQSAGRVALQESGAGIPVARVSVTAEILDGQAQVVNNNDGVTPTAVTDDQGQAAFSLTVEEDNEETIITEVRAVGQAVTFLTFVELDRPVAVAAKTDETLLVLDSVLNAVIELNPTSAALSLVSGRGRGRGELDFEEPAALAIAPDGQLVIAEALTNNNALIQVDSVSGDRQLLSQCVTRDYAIGSPGSLGFVDLRGLVIEDDGIIIVDAGFDVVVRVNRLSGDCSLVSGDGRGGDSSPFREPTAIAITPDGRLVVADAERNAVLRVDPSTGQRTLLSGCGNIDDCSTPQGSGVPLEGLIGEALRTTQPTALTVSEDKNLIVLWGKAVVEVNTETGDRTLVSGCRDHPDCTDIKGIGPQFARPSALAFAADDTLFVADQNIEEVLQVDRETGDRLVISRPNTAPTAVDDTYSLVEGQTLIVSSRSEGVLANDSDKDPDALTVFLDSQPAHGKIELSPNGTFTYIPDENFNGADTFTYRSVNAGGRTAMATVSIAVEPVNDKPVVQQPIQDMIVQQGDAPTILELDLASTFTDPDGDVLMLAVVVDNTNLGPVTTTLTGVTLTLAFTPEQQGDAQITVIATDDAGEFAQDNFTIRVIAPDVLLDVVNPGDQTNAEGEEVQLQLAVAASDPSSVTFREMNLPPGLVLDTATRRISGTIASSAVASPTAQEQSYAVTITVSAGPDEDSVNFTWKIEQALWGRSTWGQGRWSQ